MVIIKMFKYLRDSILTVPLASMNRL
jgi:hypothetical protein